jgi:hypothetical protein
MHDEEKGGKGSHCLKEEVILPVNHNFSRTFTVCNVSILVYTSRDENVGSIIQFVRVV